MVEINLSEYSEGMHLSYLKKWLSDPDLMKGWGGQPMAEEKIGNWAKDGSGKIFIVTDKTSEIVVGLVCFYGYQKQSKTIQRGTLIDPSFQSTGYGRAAILASNKLAFESMDVDKIELYIEADNEVSKHLTEKLGYIFDRFDPVNRKYYYYLPNITS